MLTHWVYGQRGEKVPNIATNEQIGRRIKLARIQKGLTQKEFALLITENGFKISNDTLSYFERGKRSMNSNFMQAAAKALGCNAADLIGYRFDGSEPNKDIVDSLRQAADIIEKMLDK